jgi:hypothetical protein
MKAGCEGNTPAVVWTFGDTPGSELGGDPKLAAPMFTKVPQLKVPDSEGGVTMGIR